MTDTAARAAPAGRSESGVADLGPARVEVGPVVAVERLGGGLIELTAELPHLAAHTAPGQFAQLRCGPSGPLLRRPFSVAWTEPGRCSFVFAVVGVGTARLAELRPGDPLDAFGPLGRGFRLLGDAGGALCIAGGLGCAPFPLLARELRAGGAGHVIVASGAATAARLYPPERYRRGDGGVEVLEATDDGSRGVAGRVTALIEEALHGALAVYACGPNPMLEAVAVALVRSTATIREASLEAPMGCGFGVCLGCALPVRESGGVGGTAWALCCREGPVMDIDRVDWPAMRSLPPPHVA